jgi:branched-chain amino acid transport system permease protein
LGLGEAFGAFYLSSEYRGGIAYALLILVILFKPSGLLGRPTAEKV